MGNAPARAASTLNGLRRIGLNYLKITTYNRSTKKEPEAEMRKKIITPNDLSAIVNPFSGVKIMTQQKWQAAEPKRNEAKVSGSN